MRKYKGDGIVRILSALEQQPAMLLDIAQESGVSYNGTWLQARRCDQLGLVATVPAPTGQVGRPPSMYQITERGRQLLEECRAISSEIDAHEQAAVELVAQAAELRQRASDARERRAALFDG